MLENRGGLSHLKFVPGDLYRGFRHQAEHERGTLVVETGMIGLSSTGFAMLNHIVDWGQQYAMEDKSGAIMLTLVATGFVLAPLGALEGIRQQGREVRRTRELEDLIQTFD